MMQLDLVCFLYTPVKKKPSCPASLTNVLTDHPLSFYWRIRSILCLPKHSHPTKDLCLTKVPETKNQNMSLKGKVCRIRGIHLPCPVGFWKISRALRFLLRLMRSSCTSPYIQFRSSFQLVKAAVSREWGPSYSFSTCSVYLQFRPVFLS